MHPHPIQPRPQGGILEPQLTQLLVLLLHQGHQPIQPFLQLLPRATCDPGPSPIAPARTTQAGRGRGWRSCTMRKSRWTVGLVQAAVLPAGRV